LHVNDFFVKTWSNFTWFNFSKIIEALFIGIGVVLYINYGLRVVQKIWKLKELLKN
jgi:uncharacterized membrane protein